MQSETDVQRAAHAARFARSRLPSAGLFAGYTWRIAPSACRLGHAMASELEGFGRVLLQFYRTANLLYRQSVGGKQPSWVAELIDQGKPEELVRLQRDPAFKHDLPRVIRPDILLTDGGWCVTELDAVPGGIGLTAWLARTYSELAYANSSPAVLGGADGMEQGFAGIFGAAKRVLIIVSKEAAAYRPEMEWLAARINTARGEERFKVCDADFQKFEPGDAVYRFFELFDLENVPVAARAFELARAGRIHLTPPPKPLFEEKLLFALLWNRNLRDFWRQELGGAFLRSMLDHAPYTWVMDPAPLPPHAAIPELNITDWSQLKTLSQRERDLVLKVSGFSELAWGARGVFLGSDMSRDDWSAAVDTGLHSFSKSPYVLQRYHKPRLAPSEWFDFEHDSVAKVLGRVRLCPYYFVHGDWENARARLGGVLATICPADKKIIHGMSEAILAPAAA